jgi:hypothetical protein
MPGYLRQSTASQSRALGPFLDDTDFKTAETALTIANTDIKLVVNGGASANKNSGGGTHRVNGVYGVTFDATDTATVGEMEVSVIVAGALPVFDKFFVVEEAVYDALFAASAPGFATVAALATVQADTDDIQTRLPAALVSGRMDASVGAMAAGVLTATAIAADAITDAKVAADVTIASVTGSVGSVTGAVGSVTGSVGSIATGGIVAASFAAGAIDASAIADDAIGALELAAGAASEVATAVRTELATELGRIDAAVSTRLASAGYTAPPSAAANADAVWDEAIADHLGVGSTGNALNNATAAGNPWEAVIEGSYTAQDLLRMLTAVAAGKTTIVDNGNGTATVTFRDVTDASDIIIASMAGSERAALTLAP